MFESAAPGAINLGLGEPDFNPPPVVVEALCEAVRNGQNKYGPSAGLPTLRDAIADRYSPHDPKTTRENVLVTSGGSEALVVAALTLYDPGDEVLVPNPGFVLYPPHARLAGATPVGYSLREEKGFLPDLSELESLVRPRTRALVVNSPSNPTGGVFPERLVQQLVDFAEEHHLAIISDEVYDEILYTSRPYPSFWGRSDRVVVVNSFSKMFAMTGWRLGYLLATRGVVAEANKIHYHLMACPSTPSQIAALKGLSAKPGEVRDMVAEFRARRDLIVRLLNRIPGVRCVSPSGAFYAFPRVDWGVSSLEVAQSLLSRGVITTPGEAFGTLGEGHLRLSFANSRENIRRGLEIMRALAEEQGHARPSPASEHGA
jgi:aspartate aminotransferase